MSYAQAMEAAGSEILEYEQFGSYQGDWWAKVSYDGRVFWVNGSYGSCSGCDAFEGEFGYSESENCDEHRWGYSQPTNCPNCDAAKQKYQEHLSEFGKRYLDQELSQQEAEKEAGRNIEWDCDAEPMLRFIQNHAIAVST